jgi:phosphatidylethanolamine/phosphatidyl-N-methylethanolamine N-methyltransferase
MNTNSWNRIRYSLYAPFYDWIGNQFNDDRRRSIDLLDLQQGEHVLLLGAGTGIDLEFLPKGVQVTAIDITPAMVNRIETRAKQLDFDVDARVMDGQALELADETFDAVVLHLILAVIPDPNACIAEASRVLKSGGRITIFDKFLASDAEETVVRRFANIVSGFFFSEINRRLEPIIETVPLRLIDESPSRFGKLGYHITVFKKIADI